MSNPRPPRTNPIPPPRGVSQKIAPVSQNVGSIVAISNDVPDIKEDILANFVKQLYDTSKITPGDLHLIYETVSYKGFDRKDVMKQLASFVKDTRLATEIIIAVALQGPQRACRIKLTNGQTPAQMGIPASGGQGVKTLTLNKILSATADLAAFFLKQLNIPKKMNIELPGWLQFPSAGSIKMPEKYKEMHVEFSKQFSQLIGGQFNEQIYMTMQANAYLDESLHLF